MTFRRTAMFSLLLTGLLWSFFSWPLPKYFAEGIPSSANNTEKWNVRRMSHGDHLQLLYNYWLFSDMLTGKTPFFYNLYEFNTGDDSKLRAVGSVLDQPFTFFYAITSWIGGRAFGWNLTGFVSLWLTYLFTWLLLQKYTTRDSIAALTALIAIALPCRWVALLGGSPAGFAMMWVPIILWGIDSALRQNRILGGGLAAVAVLCSYWNDTHVFFFSILLIPCWCIAVILHHEGFEWKRWDHWRKTVLALLPMAIAVVILVIVALLNQHDKLAESGIADGRSFREVALYSPNPRGVFDWSGSGHDSQIYIGYILPILIFAGCLIQLFLFIRHPKSEWRNLVFAVFLVVGLIWIVLLALGTKGPFDAGSLRVARQWIPPYAMIRQPAKIFLVFPPLLGLVTLLSLNTIFRFTKNSKGPVFAAAVLLLTVCAAFGLRVHASVCLLDQSQSAYEVVARDAQENHRLPRALIIPLWPGDSAWSSLYEHYVSLYRIRMINGYTPIVPCEYVENVFNALESANSGLLTKTQIDSLQERGIDYILLHEDAFPEKVSYFPVSLTLKRLLNHPRLKLLHQGQNVWAFKIQNLAEPRPEIMREWNIFFPNMHYEMEWSSCSNALVLQDPTASGQRFLRMKAENSLAHIEAFEHLQAPNSALLIRCRGHGQGEIRLTLDRTKGSPQVLDVDSEAWRWIEIPLGDISSSRWAVLDMYMLNGSVDLDLAIYSSGHLPRLAKGKTFSLQGPLFFHAGYTDLSENSVNLRTDYEPADGIFYGPKLPLETGQYEITLTYQSRAPQGTILGSFRLANELEETPLIPVIAGQSAKATWLCTHNLPVTLTFFYSRLATMQIQEVVFLKKD